MSRVNRCAWVPEDDPLYVAYHDEEWGVPTRDVRALFELLNLEGAQAGLSWMTILRRREGYRKAFAGFDPEAVARFDDTDVQRLLADTGIIGYEPRAQEARLWLRRAVHLLLAHAGLRPRQRPRRELLPLREANPIEL